MSQLPLLFLFLSLLFPTTLPLSSSTQPFHVSNSSSTIPAIPSQSTISSSCPRLPPSSLHVISFACSSSHLLPTRCCPLLSAYLYSAYSLSALSPSKTTPSSSPNSYQMPLLPDDTEECAGSVEEALGPGVGPNQTCDVAYCYCGIRLHPLSCPGGFEVAVGPGKEEELAVAVGEESVRRLETDCLDHERSTSTSTSRVAKCSKCLNTLYQLKESKYGRTNKSEERMKKMQNKDCELMGLTWLLHKNMSAYIDIVSLVLKTLMMNTDGHDHPHFCSPNSDGMPLAVDSSEINGQPSSTILPFHIFLCILSFYSFSFFLPTLF